MATFFTVLVLVIVLALVLVLLVMWAVIRSSRETLDAVAEACSVDRDSLRARVDSGVTLQEVAAEYGVDAEQVAADTMAHSKHRWVAWISRRADWERVLR